MRRNLHETDDVQGGQKAGAMKRESSLRALLKYPREVLLVVGLTMGGTTAFYTYTTYMQKFLKLSVGLTDNQTTLVTAGFADLRAVSAADLRHDFRPHRPQVAADRFGVAGTLFTIPILDNTAIGEERRSRHFCLIAAAWMIVSGYTSINAVVKAELFPTKVRATGVGLPYALTVSIFGGTADSVALWFKTIGHESWFYYYLTGIIFAVADRLCVHARHARSIPRCTGTNKAGTIIRMMRFPEGLTASREMHHGLYISQPVRSRRHPAPGLDRGCRHADGFVWRIDRRRIGGRHVWWHVCTISRTFDILGPNRGAAFV